MYTVTIPFVRSDDPAKPVPIPCSSLKDADNIVAALMADATIRCISLTAEIRDDIGRCVGRKSTWFPLKAPVHVQ